MQEVLRALKPSTKSLIIDAVESVGIDVTEWRKSGADNPSYCYHWAFADRAREKFLFCLWYDDCVIGDVGIHQAWNFREYIRELESDGGPKAGRAREVDELLQDAWRKKLPVRVAIVDETAARKASKTEGESSKAAFRELDAEPWHLAHYDLMTGDCVIVRGATLARAESGARVSGGSATPQVEQAAASGENEAPVSPPDEVVEDLMAQVARTDVSGTTRNALISARIGQGSFRAALIHAWEGRCAATGCAELAVLRASHIKPWRLSNDIERLDPENGLLLSANLDALFDQGLITFADSGRMLLAKVLARQTLIDLGLPLQLRRTLSERQRHFMRFHRDERFKKS